MFKDLINKIKPNIMGGMIGMVLLAVIAGIIGWRMNSTEIITAGVVGSIFALKDIAMKLMDDENHD